MLYLFRSRGYLVTVSLLLLTTSRQSCSAIAVVTQHVRIGTRPSPLARQQAESIAQALHEANPSITTELVLLNSASEIKSATATTQAKPLAMSYVDFVSTVDNAILDGTVDVGVHSLKDVPPDHRWCSDLLIACHLPRPCPLDVLIGADSLQSLPQHARVGSASVRRQAQLLAIRPDILPINLRGNVQTRLEALEEEMVDALVMARAGLERLGIELHNSHCMLNEILPAPAQGTVGAICRRDDTKMMELLATIDNEDAHLAATVERTVLNVVDDLAPWDGRPPVAVYLEPTTDAWVLRCLLARPDGQRVLRTERRFPRDTTLDDATSLAIEAGEELRDKVGLGFFYSVHNVGNKQ
jgi:hydroxymethylbilane synthase